MQPQYKGFGAALTVALTGVSTAHVANGWPVFGNIGGRFPVA
jgi:hypothetical protein